MQREGYPPAGYAVGIPLRNRAGHIVAFTVVDAADFEAVAAHRWHMTDKGYARRSTFVGGRVRCIRLHRELLCLPPEDRREVDHINGDKLDNRRANLRLVDHGGNMANLRGPYRWPGRTSSYRGVSWDRASRKWRARVRLHGKLHALGSFENERDAAEAAAAFRRKHMPTSEVDRRAPTAGE